ncbi:hypothetical protein AAFF_G00162380 [Aldrovandia affinis]|uniref:Centrosomal protein of 162 kDa n=1 Tax=Aldrovandia affinis TaxID=143900 RepID=A0AAD7SZB5_9TELE|nr:hypothetical protein AAFF_G00162380 [Aldrovandia affinis]
MSRRLTKEELDEQFEQFLKESVSDESADLGSSSKRSSVLDSLGKTRPKPPEKSPVSQQPWWQGMEDSEDPPGRGRLASGKTFRKSLRRSLPIQEEEDEEQPKAMGRREEEQEVEGTEQVLMSRDSLEPEDSVVASGPVGLCVGMGLDTLDEEEEKARFFSQLERGASSTIDYSRLNRELESSLSTPAHTLRQAEDAGIEEEQRKEGAQESRISPASPNYSEDFEEEISAKEPAQAEKPDTPPMLAKVSLHDSLDSTGGAPQPEANEEAGREEWAGPGETEAMGAAQSYGQSGFSEVEALQEAYRQTIASVGGAEEQGGQSATPGDNARRPTSRSPTPRTPPQRTLTPERSPGTGKNSMATGSDLPTAEELMRPIRPESGTARGFSLQPISGASSRPDSTPTKRRDKEAEEEEEEGRRRVREEVERLMEFEEDSLHTSTPPPPRKDRKQQLPVWSPGSWGPPSSSSWRKKELPPAKSKRGTGRPSPTATKLPGPGRAGPAAKPSPPPQRKALTLGSNKSLKPGSLRQGGPGSSADPGSKVSSELIASVQSFADYLQQEVERSVRQGSSESHRPPERKSEIREDTWRDVPGDRPRGSAQREREAALLRRSEDAQERLSAERHLVDRMRLQLEQKEAELLAREAELRLVHGTEVAALQQENYLLQSKLRGMEELRRKRKWSFGEASAPVTEEQLKLIEKEVKEQETLIQGYHQENEKLYQQVKGLEAQRKQNEEAMFQENQRLLSELAIAREQINRNNTQRIVGKDSEPAPSRSQADLSAQLQAAQKVEVRLAEEIRRLRQEKQGLEVDLELMRKERDQAKAQVIHASGDLSFEMRTQVEEHKVEVEALKKRLQWYAENQELLDKDAARLRAATTEIQRLKEQVERLRMEVGRRDGLQQKKVEKSGDAKRIQDLERQVKEMEKILRRRHPNSLPALIFAAASAGGGGAGALENPQTVALLERRAHRLEAELEGRDEEAKRSLRAMEQQYHRIKMQYEERISELEQQLAQVSEADGAQGSPQDWESRARSLQAELEGEREAGRARERTLQAELGSLREQPNPGPPGEREREREAQVEQLTQELAAKSRSVQELSRTVERLQKERRSLLSEGRRGLRGRGGAGGGAGAEPFPPTLDEKDYQPTAFSGSHISEVLQEREALRVRLERLQLEAERERVSLQGAAAQTEAELRRTQERAHECMLSLRAQHQKEMEGLLARHALEHSTSKLAELANQVSMQEVVISHLRDQLKDLQGSREALTLSQVREETLQNQMAKLLEDLREAKESHTPELRHFSALEKKIRNMELRHTQRERELQQVIAQTRMVAEAEQQREVERWRRQAQTKGQELEAFRVELDSILDVLRELQRQGVVIPIPKAASRTEPLTQSAWGT